MALELPLRVWCALRAETTPAARGGGPVPLEQGQGAVSMGRSPSFPFPQWHADDEWRTVHFDEGEGDPLVFVHGLGGNVTHWEHLAADLVRDHRVLGLDSLGAGATAKPPGRYTVDRLRDHLLAFLDDRGLDRVTLVGHSLGGTVCLAAALARPQLCRRLILVGAAGLAPLPAWMRLGAPFVLHRHLLFPALQLAANFILDHCFVTSADENPYVAHFRRSSLRDAPGYPHLRDFARVSATLCRDVVHRDYGPRLGELDCPVLALWGDADHLVALPGVEQALQRFRRARVEILPETGHLSMIERPREVLDHVRRFLADHPV
jgi:pimeloyl-ACP methyl ester carboxylesterase